MILAATNMFIDSFIGYLKNEKKYSQHTLRAYSSDLRSCEAFLQKVDSSLTLLDADVDLLRSWVSDIVEKGGAATSVCRKLSTLRSFYNYVRTEVDLRENPAMSVRAPRCNKKLPVFVKEQEINKLLDEVVFGDDFNACRDKTIIMCFYETGMRLSELVGLDVPSVDMQQGQIKVLGKRNRERIIPFATELREELAHYIKERSNIVASDEEAFFVTIKGVRMTQSQVYRLVGRRLSAVTTAKKKSPHTLRHSFATAMLNNNAELVAVKELLGHKRLATTEIYTHLTFEELKRCYKKAHPRADIN